MRLEHQRGQDGAAAAAGPTAHSRRSRHERRQMNAHQNTLASRSMGARSQLEAPFRHCAYPKLSPACPGCLAPMLLFPTGSDAPTSIWARLAGPAGLDSKRRGPAGMSPRTNLPFLGSVLRSYPICRSVGACRPAEGVMPPYRAAVFSFSPKAVGHPVAVSACEHHAAVRRGDAPAATRSRAHHQARRPPKWQRASLPASPRPTARPCSRLRCDGALPGPGSARRSASCVSCLTAPLT
jgi:hypothetical protein